MSPAPRPGSESVVFPLADTEGSVGARFATQVRQYGHRVALHTSSATVIYRDLASAAGGIAGQLMDRLGPAEHPVLLLLRDDVRFVSAFVACLQAGKICVPVDPDHPLPRLAAIWRDSGARLLVTDGDCIDLARRIAGDSSVILDVTAGNGDSGGAFRPPDIPPDRRACVLYTSGSSGAPKGVIYTHRTLLHAVLKLTNTWNYRVEDRLSLLTARGTAAELAGIFGTLLIGAELHPYHLRQAGLPALNRWLREREITIWRLAPSTFRNCVQNLRAGEVFPSLRFVRLGGEPSGLRELELFRRHCPPGCVLGNAYATTETGLVRVRIFDHDTPVAGHVLPVGYSVPDTEVVVVDPSGQPAQPGEAGEIVVRSEYLTEGYWNRPDLTAAAFLPDPDGGRRRLYRTGDLGRMAPDGCLEHLGRCDQQVKVRGYRVELAEVEAALLLAPAVTAAVAAVHDDGRGGNRLVGYVVPAAGSRPAAADLRAFLKDRLPDHMVPGAYVVLDQLPTTGAGKVDRRSLPLPPDDSGGAPAGTGPRTHLEVQLAGIWAEILKRPTIGLQEDFFDLGGDSLLATQMLERVEHDCGAAVDPSRLLSSLTVERLATEILSSSREILATPVVLVQSGVHQRPFFFLHSDLDSGGFYCRRLARALGPEVTMYAVQPHGMDGAAVPDTIEEMAAERLQSILEVQPVGPYSLGGFCGGGIIAYEMARQLVAKGEQVETVLLIDAHPPNLAHRSSSRLARGIATGLRLPPQMERTLFLRLKWYREELRDSGRGDIAAWIGLLGKKLKAALASVGTGPAQLNAAPDPVSGDDMQSLWSQYHGRMSYHVPGHLTGRVALFRSSYMEDDALRDAAAGWGTITGGVDVHCIPGDHQTCVTTYVADLAARMRPYLPGWAEEHPAMERSPSHGLQMSRNPQNDDK